MKKDIHVSHKGQGAATNREKGQSVTRTRAGAAPCKNGLERKLLYSMPNSSNLISNIVAPLSCDMKKSIDMVSYYKQQENTFIVKTGSLTPLLPG
jgi:hypothetical protein